MGVFHTGRDMVPITKRTRVTDTICRDGRLAPRNSLHTSPCSSVPCLYIGFDITIITSGFWCSTWFFCSLIVFQKQADIASNPPAIPLPNSPKYPRLSCPWISTVAITVKSIDHTVLWFVKCFYDPLGYVLVFEDRNNALFTFLIPALSTVSCCWHRL